MSVTNRRTVLQRAAVVSGAIFGTSSRINATTATDTQKVDNAMTADDIRSLLELEPNATCGFVRETYRAAQAIARGGLPAPFTDGRPLGSALYFMVMPAAPVKLHRIRNDQLYHYYLGDPLEVLLLRGKGERIIVGPDLRAGQHVQLLIPGNTFHTARIIGTKRWFLGASTEWPGVVPADVELGNSDALTAEFPEVAADVRNSRACTVGSLRVCGTRKLTLPNKDYAIHPRSALPPEADVGRVHYPVSRRPALWVDFLYSKFSRVKRTQRSASSSRQRIDHLHPEGLTTRLGPVE